MVEFHAKSPEGVPFENWAGQSVNCIAALAWPTGMTTSERMEITQKNARIKATSCRPGLKGSQRGHTPNKNGLLGRGGRLEDTAQHGAAIVKLERSTGERQAAPNHRTMQNVADMLTPLPGYRTAPH